MKLRSERIMLIIIVVLVSVCCLYAWNKISSSENCIVKIADSKPTVPAPVKQPTLVGIAQKPVPKKPLKHKKDTIKVAKALPVENTKVDTIKKVSATQMSTPSVSGKNIITGGTFTAPVHNGDSYETPPRELTPDEKIELNKELSKIFSENKSFDKNSTIRYLVSVNDAEALKFTDKIYGLLAINGYIKFEVRYAIFTGIRPTNFKATTMTENGKELIVIEVYSQKSVAGN